MYRTLIVGMLAWAACSSGATDYYVDADAGFDGFSGLCAVWDGGACGPKRTIAAGIAAASDGDSVIIAPGTYAGAGNRDVSYGGKAITVRGTNPDDPAVVAATVIDCEGTSAARHRGFVFNMGEGQDSILAGLTVKNGFAPNYSLPHRPPPYTYPAGGAVLCSGAGPRIYNCVFEACMATYGGALCFDNSSDVLVTGCVIRGNSACALCVSQTAWTPGGGGVAMFGSSAVFEHCTISQNQVPNTTVGTGGGMHVETSRITLSGCSIDQNQVGMLTAGRGMGGGVYVADSEVRMVDSQVIENVSQLSIADTESYGGGIYVLNRAPAMPGVFVAERCRILRNRTRFSGGGLSINIRPVDQVLIRDSLIAGNISHYYGPAFQAVGPGHIDILNSTLTANTSTLGTASIYLQTPPPTVAVSNSIIWSTGNEFFGGTNVTATFSNIRNGWLGATNIDVDPMFVDAAHGDYHLSPGSPCINAGDPAYSAPTGELDIDGQVRIWGGRIDMGADEHASFGVGDLNCDGSLNQFDINGFWIALSDRDAYPDRFPNCSVDLADMNYDGSINQFDIAGFVHALTH